jgi:hypothetical protein
MLEQWWRIVIIIISDATRFLQKNVQKDVSGEGVFLDGGDGFPRAYSERGPEGGLGGFGLFEVVVSLEVDEHTRVNAEEFPEAQGGIGVDVAFSGADFANPALRDTRRRGRGGLGDVHFGKVVVAQDNPGMWIMCM